MTSFKKIQGHSVVRDILHFHKLRYLGTTAD